MDLFGIFDQLRFVRPSEGAAGQRKISSYNASAFKKVAFCIPL
jgi:hypothetical protein